MYKWKGGGAYFNSDSDGRGFLERGLNRGGGLMQLLRYVLASFLNAQIPIHRVFCCNGTGRSLRQNMTKGPWDEVAEIPGRLAALRLYWRVCECPFKQKIQLNLKMYRMCVISAVVVVVVVVVATITGIMSRV